MLARLDDLPDSPRHGDYGHVCWSGCDYDKKEIEKMCKQLPKGVPDRVVEAMESIISNYWQDEKEDFLEQVGAGENPATLGHLFKDLIIMDNWLNAENVSYEDYL